MAGISARPHLVAVIAPMALVALLAPLELLGPLPDGVVLGSSEVLVELAAILALWIRPVAARRRRVVLTAIFAALAIGDASWTYLYYVLRVPESSTTLMWIRVPYMIAH